MDEFSGLKVLMFLEEKWRHLIIINKAVAVSINKENQNKGNICGIKKYSKEWF